MSYPTIKRLEAGAYHVRFSLNKFVQWPRGRAPTHNDTFGWVSTDDLILAEKLALALEDSEKGESHG